MTYTRDARVLLATRTVRSFSDGFVSVLLAGYLSLIGFSGTKIGAIATATLIGTAIATVIVGQIANGVGRRRILLAATLVAAATGLSFATLTEFWPLMLVAVAGTLNPSAGDVSVFLPLEQSILPETVEASRRTDLFARYNLAGSLAAAAGALSAATPSLAHRAFGWDVTDVMRGFFVLYAGLAMGNFVAYRTLSAPAAAAAGVPGNAPLHKSRGIVLQLSALFALDSFAGGFVVQSMLALWLFERYGLSVDQAAVIFFAAGSVTAFSYLVSARIANRIGLINTMVLTHLPSNLLLIVVAVMPNVWLAVAMLLLRQCLSQMDVPARQSYVMSVVEPDERAAAASITNVPRSLSAGVSPVMSGALLAVSSFGWPLVIAGSLKAVYDLLLLRSFRSVRPGAS